MKNRPEKTREELAREVRETYRRVFSSTEGMTVLSHMLASLGLFNETTDSPEETARQNYARELLRTLGMLTDDAEKVQKLVKDWFKIGRDLFDLPFIFCHKQFLNFRQYYTHGQVYIKK